MSHQVLAVKWRPKSFSQVMGQQHVLQALVNSLQMGRLHHAYLFSGTRGVGKTTIARILAKSLNCEQGVTATPCGICSSCTEIDEGRFVDLLEIDAASRTRVEDTRELLDNVQYLPTRGRYKVYLIDEVHMLSRHSFNALLKTLEEPPEHVKFLLATTDPQKLPVTVLSRCLQFNLKPLQKAELELQLKNVLTHESIDFEPEALSLLSDAADGSVRDALSLTEQALAYGQGRINTADICTMLGTISPGNVVVLLTLIKNKEATAVMQWVDEMAVQGADFTGLFNQLLLLLHEIARSQLIAEPLEQDKALLANDLDPEQIQLFYQIVLMAKKDLPYAIDEKSAFEMALLRLLSFAPEPLQAKPALIKTQQAPRSSSITVEHNAAAVVSDAGSLVEAHPSAEHIVSEAPHSATHLSNKSLSENKELAEPFIEPPNTSEDAVLQAQALQEQSDVLAQAQLQQSQLQAENTPSLSSAQQPKTEVVHEPEPTSEPVSEPVSLGLDHLLASHHQLRSHRLSRGNSSSKAITSVNVAPTEAFVKKTEPAPQLAIGVPVVVEQVAEPTSADEVLSSSSSPNIAASFVEEQQPVANKASGDFNCFNDAEQWQKVIDRLKFDPILRQLLLNSTLFKRADVVQVMVRPELKNLLEPNSIAALTDGLRAEFCCEIHVFSSQDTSGETPIEWQRRRHQEKLDAAYGQLSEDPNVMHLQQKYEATLERDSVRYIPM